MNKLHIIVGVLYIAVMPLFSQTLPKPASSNNKVDEGIKLHDEGKYEEAINIYSSISRNDSAYLRALIEKGLSLLAMGRNEEAIAVSDLALKVPGGRASELYNLKGSSLDNVGKSEEALKVYNEGLKYYPYYAYLHYNKGLTLQKLGRVPEAVKCYEDALRINPFHVSSHLRLGQISASEGKYTQALLAYDAYLCLAAADTNALKALTYIDRIISQKNDLTPAENIFTEGDDFSDLDLIIGNHLALNNQYKVRMKLDYPIVRQNQALLDNLKYNPNDKGFWNQFYTPFFLRIVKEDRFNLFILRILACSTNESISAIINKKLSDIIKFNDWTGDSWSSAHEYIPLMVDGKEITVKRWLENGKLVALGNEAEKDKDTGYWEYLFTSGAISSCGYYNANGERIGNWTFYNQNGTLKNKAEYENGKLIGVLYTYDENGSLKKTEPYKQGVVEGLSVEYFPSGDTFATYEMKNDNVNGLHTSYYPIKTKLYVLQKKESKLDGLQKKFMDNQQVALEVEYKDDKKVGNYSEYFRGGQVSAKYYYQNDMPEGPYSEYYPDGTKKESGNFIRGELDGTKTTYYINGKVQDSYTYKIGTAVDTARFYDDDGILYEQWIYDKEGTLVSTAYFDKSGKRIANSTGNKKKFVLTDYYPNGMKDKEGVFENNRRAGTWKYYSSCGALKTIEDYQDGELNGDAKEYFRNGMLSSVTKYSAGKMEGQYTAYYSGGNIMRTGWDVDDKLEGDWYYYNPDGNIEQHLFYVKGEQEGWQQNYDTYGKLEHEFLIKDGRIQCDVFYDTLGQVYDSVVLPNSSGLYLSHYQNGAPGNNIQYINGIRHGNVEVKNCNGVKIIVGAYFNGQETGKWIYYYDDGSVNITGYYYYGEKDSTWSYYDESGKLYRIEKYDWKKKTRLITRFAPNGTVTEKWLRVDDDKEGEDQYFDPMGEFMFTLYYHHGVILGYSYPDANGKPVKMISLPQETGKVDAYFKSGKKSAELEIRNGWYENNATYYYSNGTVWRTMVYKEDDLSGPYKEYTPDGKIFHESDFLYDQMQGLSNVYSPNGTLIQSISYHSGHKDGIMKVWNDKGELLHTYNYRNDVLQNGK